MAVSSILTCMGNAGQQISLDEALDGMIVAFGVATEHKKLVTRADKERMIRTKLSGLAAEGKRILIVVDNVASIDQVVSLQPGDPAHRFLVTSRSTLQLPASRIIEVERLIGSESIQLVASALRMAWPDDPRFLVNLTELNRLAELCDHLPLALRIAAQILVGDRAESVAELTERLVFRDSVFFTLVDWSWCWLGGGVDGGCSGPSCGRW